MLRMNGFDLSKASMNLSEKAKVANIGRKKTTMELLSKKEINI